MNKTERDELRRLLRARFKLLRSDVEARKAELEAELEQQVHDHFAESDRRYDALMFKLSQVVNEANRAANDIGRELWGREQWGEKTDKNLISSVGISKPGKTERWQMTNEGKAQIEKRVKAALLELARQETELLTELATSALESAEARAFFARIPSVSELVPSYRLQEITRD